MEEIDLGEFVIQVTSSEVNFIFITIENLEKNLPSTFYLAAFLLGFTTICGDLNSQLDCATETNGVRMTVTKDECPNACAKAANGMAGCCEWQDDWSVCIFVPGEKTKQSAGQRAGVECTAEQGLLKQF